MARKVEIGIDYYPCNTDHVTHKKIKLLVSDHKSDGFWIYECLKCEIYRVKGYFMNVADQDDLTMFAQDICKLPVSLVNDVIAACIKRELFNKNLYDQHKILTSDRIQENYLGATNRRTAVKMIREYLLIDPSSHEKIVVVDINGLNVSIYPQNVDSIARNDDSGTQRKGKESKVKEIGEGEYSIPPELFEKLFKYLRKNVEKFYPQERIRAQNEMMEWQGKNSITQELVENDAEANKKNSDQIEWCFKKHIGRDMTVQIENCYTHYARTGFLIDGQPIKAWIPVLAGWMNKRERFKKKSA